MYSRASQAHATKNQEVGNAISQQQHGNGSAFQFVDNRPEAAIQRKLQRIAHKSPQASLATTFQRMANSSPQAQKIAQLQSGDKWVGKTIQLVNRITMHSPPQDVRLAGGGIGSGIDTGVEIAAVIAANNLEDLNDTRAALNRSINLRRASPNPDEGHAARIIQEQGWLAQLDAVIAPLEKAKQANWQAMLRGPKPPPAPPGAGWTAPPGAVWGK